MLVPLNNIRSTNVGPLTAPSVVKRLFPISGRSHDTVAYGRAEIEDILTGRDKRLLMIVGPCSIHDPVSALHYARRLVNLRNIHNKKLCIIMRVYLEKPRTTVGWKGYMNDPFLDDSCNINEGAKRARKMLCRITDRGLPVATEFVDPFSPQFFDDLVSWTAIGARTTESQTHREMASGLSMPVGFKNGTGGSVQIAVDAILAARASHTFRGIDEKTGQGCLIRTKGNPYGHLVLRGGKNGANYNPKDVKDAVGRLEMAKIEPRMIVDCSHANAAGDYRNQQHVLRSVVEQRNEGNTALVGMMLESHLVAGRQNFADRPLVYGQSVTDACIGWEDTEASIKWISDNFVM